MKRFCLIQSCLLLWLVYRVIGVYALKNWGIDFIINDF